MLWKAGDLAILGPPKTKVAPELQKYRGEVVRLDVRSTNIAGPYWEVTVRSDGLKMGAREKVLIPLPPAPDHEAGRWDECPFKPRELVDA